MKGILEIRRKKNLYPRERINLVRYTCHYCGKKKVVGSKGAGFICANCDVRFRRVPVDYWKNLKIDEKIKEGR